MGCTSSTTTINQTNKHKNNTTNSPTNINNNNNNNLTTTTNLSKKDINNYIIKLKINEVIIKSNHIINNEQFIIEDCNHCNIFLLDSIATMTIDECKNCYIVTGPISSSIFIRNCSDTVIVTACQQLRLRDCTNLKILLCSLTGPIIESSRNIGIGCYSYGYFGIEDNFKETGLSCWTNKWFDVYDFTPAIGNFHLLQPSVSHHELITAAQPLIEQGMAPQPTDRRFVPLTYGPSYSFSGETITVLCCFPTNYQNQFRDSLESISPGSTSIPYNISDLSSTPILLLIRTIIQKFDLSQLTTLIGKEKEAKKTINQWKLTSTSPKTPIYELLIVQLIINQQTALTTLTDGLKTACTGNILTWNSNEADTKSQLIFDQWKQMT